VQIAGQSFDREPRIRAELRTPRRRRVAVARVGEKAHGADRQNAEHDDHDDELDERETARAWRQRAHQ